MLLKQNNVCIFNLLDSPMEKQCLSQNIEVFFSTTIVEYIELEVMDSYQQSKSMNNKGKRSHLYIKSMVYSQSVLFVWQTLRLYRTP